MFPYVLPVDIGVPYQDQWFKADVDIKPTADEKGFSVTLSNVEISNARIQVLTVDADGAIKRSRYRTLDITLVEIMLDIGGSVIVKVRPIGGPTSVTYKVISVNKDLETGTSTLNAWVIDDDPIIPGTHLSGASVAITTFPPQPDGVDSLLDCDWHCRDAFIIKLSDSNYEIIEFDDAGGRDQGDLVEALILFARLIKGRVPVQISAKRVGSKKTATMVGFLDRVCVDGRRIELKISKKGLKSKGCAAKKAVAGFKSGAYELLNIEPIGRASSNPPRYNWITATGTLTKTGITGEFKMKFMTKSRIYNYDEEKKEVSSKSANQYLEEVAQSLPGIAASTLVKLLLEPLETGTISMRPIPQLYGLMLGLARSTPVDGAWIPTVKTSLADAEMLGDVTDVKRIKIGIGMW
jgi:hypothetical protein